MDRDFLARQVAAAGDPAVITIATAIPATAKEFIITCVDGPVSLTLTLTGPGTAYSFAYGTTPWIRVLVNDGTPVGTAAVTAISLDGAGAGNCTLIGFWN